jgi:hypothetical protein
MKILKRSDWGEQSVSEKVIMVKLFDRTKIFKCWDEIFFGRNDSRTGTSGTI